MSFRLLIIYLFIIFIQVVKTKTPKKVIVHDASELEGKVIKGSRNGLYLVNHGYIEFDYLFLYLILCIVFRQKAIVSRFQYFRATWFQC